MTQQGKEFSSQQVGPDKNQSISKEEKNGQEKPSISFNKFHFFSVILQIPGTIWILGLAMGLLNISVIIIYSLSALQLNTTFGVGALWIGLLEGVVEGLSFLMKLFSGVFSDYLKKRKHLMVVGYALTAISKPIIGLSTGFYSVFTARIIERLGNGFQSTPRDAMVGDIAPDHIRGTCYGFQRGLGIIGSITGAVLGVALMQYFNDDFQPVFLLASIPAFLALSILVFFVKESKLNRSKGDVVVNNVRRHPIHWTDLKRLGRHYWMLMIVISIFWLARFSETFIVLHAHNNLGLAKSDAPYIMMTYNITYCLSSFSCGYLSDKIGRYSLMIVMMCVLMLSDIFLYAAPSMNILYGGILLWGVQMGMAMNLFTTKIADLAPADLRGTAFGCYYLISSVSVLVAGTINGMIMQNASPAMTFLVSMTIAGLALAALLVFLPNTRKKFASMLHHEICAFMNFLN